MFQNLFARKAQKPKSSQPTPHLIDLQDVVKSYATASGDFLALKNVSLQVDGGEFVAVIGKSGSGNPIVVADEPTGTLDSRTADAFRNLTGY